MDKIDLRIISHLNESNYSNKELSAELRKKPETISNHINSLIENKVIKHFYYSIDFTKLGYIQIKVYLKFLGIDKKNEIIEFLKSLSNNIWIAELEGKYDLAASFLIKEISEIAEIHELLTNKFSNLISEKEFLITKESSYFAFNYDKELKNSEIIKYVLSNENYKLKDDEINLLRIIATNKKESLLEIANKNKVNYENAAYVLKKLKRDGIITSNKPFIDLRKIGFYLNKLCFSFKKYDPIVEKELKSFISKKNNATQYLKLIGHWDYEIEFIVKNKEQQKEFINEFRNIFKDYIQDYFILEIDEEHKMKLVPF